MNIVGEIKYFLDDDFALLKFSESLRSFSIDIVMVPAEHRKRGIGTILTNHIIVMADCYGKEVHVSVRPIGNFSEEKLQRLIEFYKRFGFELLDRGLTIAYMVRKTFSKG